MIGFRVKNLTIDTKKIQRSAQQAERRVLSRFGYLVRRGAMQSIRRRKGISQSGQRRVAIG